MSEQKSVQEEIAELVERMKLKRKGEVPHLDIIHTYRRYLAEEKEKDPKKTIQHIQLEFGRFYNKSMGWVGGYARLSNLHPDLLPRINATDKPISITTAQRLGTIPRPLQKEILEKAQARSEKPHYLWNEIDKVYRETLGMPSRGEVIAKRLVVTPPPVATPVIALAKPRPLPFIPSYDESKRRKEEEEMKRALASVTPQVLRQSNPRTAQQKNVLDMWVGPREVHKNGKNY